MVGGWWLKFKLTLGLNGNNTEIIAYYLLDSIELTQNLLYMFHGVCHNLDSI